ncbi:TniQ family protein [Saccharopolyspora hattusasensis]|uniref:TniQ family protein n=1 Tax=Saccharopolyspora hattusasensis TaxID=1128679 RepID=UPI003D9737F0
MKLWQQHAQQLPVRVRPLRLETLTSYATRLAAANELARPTILLRALGHPHGNLAATTMNDYDIALNPPALARLETFTGIPAQRLRKSLPVVNNRSFDLPADIPRIKLFRHWGLRRICDRCAARIPGTPTILAYRQEFPAICLRHRRWLDADKQQRPALSQVDLDHAPEILTAHRRYRRMHARIVVDADSSEWFRRQMLTAMDIVSAWVIPSRRDHPRLHETWSARTAALWPWLTVAVPSDPLVFPEAVALAEIITDLHWHRHVAMARYDTDLRPFFHRVAAKLGQPRMFAITTRCSGSRDPLRWWVNSVRHRFEAVRTEHWRRAWAPGPGRLDDPFPEIRHFK